MDLGLKGKVALVSGASKGLGYGVARALAADGARVSICSRDQASVDAAVEKLRAETGADVIGFVADVAKAADVQAWIDGSVAQFGKVDALLVNAGGPPGGLFKDITDAQWQGAFDLTVMSAVRMIRTAIPHLNAGAAILTITSSSVQEPIERLVLSTAMRMAVVGIVKTLADELASSGIRVNNIIPGRIDTDRVAQLDQAAATRGGITFEEARARSLTKIPFGRLGSIDEFGSAAAYLLSPAASYITGASLRVDGGMMRSV